MKTCEELAARARAQPDQHIGRLSLKAFAAYKSGYEIALRHRGLPGLKEVVNLDVQWDWIHTRVCRSMTHEHQTRLNHGNAISFVTVATLLSADDFAAFETFLELRQEMLSECDPSACEDEPPGQAPTSTRQETFSELFDKLVQWPAMFLGNDRSISDLWAFCSGYRWALSDCGATTPEVHSLFGDFQQWMETRYPFARGCTWDRIIHFLALGSMDAAIRSLVEHLELFRRGSSPDCPDPGNAELLRNIREHAKAVEPSAVADGEGPAAER